MRTEIMTGMKFNVGAANFGNKYTGSLWIQYRRGLSSDGRSGRVV